MSKRIWKAAIVSILAVSLMSLGIAYAQKKVGGGDITFTPQGAEPVVFSHASHMEAKLKCTDCHTKIFKMKKGVDKITQASFKEGKFCGACHDGKKAFSATSEADCSKCHKKG